jgi:hypothetical protein
LKTRSKGNPVKVAVAARLRAQTTMTVAGSRSAWGWEVAAISTLAVSTENVWRKAIIKN